MYRDPTPEEHRQATEDIKQYFVNRGLPEPKPEDIEAIIQRESGGKVWELVPLGGFTSWNNYRKK